MHHTTSPSALYTLAGVHATAVTAAVAVSCIELLMTASGPDQLASSIGCTVSYSMGHCMQTVIHWHSRSSCLLVSITFHFSSLRSGSQQEESTARMSKMKCLDVHSLCTPSTDLHLTSTQVIGISTLRYGSAAMPSCGALWVSACWAVAQPWGTKAGGAGCANNCCSCAGTSDQRTALISFLIIEGKVFMKMPTFVYCCCNTVAWLLLKVQPFNIASLTRRVLSSATVLWWYRKICCQKWICSRNRPNSASRISFVVDILTPSKCLKISCANLLLLHQHLVWPPRLHKHSLILVTPRCQIACTA